MMTRKIEINEDLRAGRYYGASLSHLDSITLYGCRYEVGLDTGDGQGAPLLRIPLHAYRDHTMIGDVKDLAAADYTQPDSDLPPLYTTVREYQRLCDDFAADVDADEPITIFADSTWCRGHYDGSQTTESLVQEPAERPGK